MKLTEIVRINEKGEVTIPQTIRDNIGIVEGMHVMLKVDIERREICIIPFMTSEADLVEFKITLADVPGALAKCATFLSENNINLVASESRQIQSGEIAEWIVVADISKCKSNIRDLCKKLVNDGFAKDSVCRSFQ
ncbi:MAG: ACT domain-containing protein [Candidatus Heimdallarchaeota archaeon]|nr:ACT domain-containing protein [Candidatus Heimdallarchaeota archaeon]